MGLFILPRTNAAAHRHPQRTCLAALALACLLTANAGTLAGCASSHPITKSGEQCASCHSDGRAAVEGTGSASATETGLTFAVESGAGEVYLCTAALTEDGTVIPSRDRTLSADELGAVTVSRPGLYALCTGDIASPSATVLINATGSGPADAVVCEDAVYASRTAKQCGFYLIDIEDETSAADQPELQRLADQYITDWTQLDWTKL